MFIINLITRRVGWLQLRRDSGGVGHTIHVTRGRGRDYFSITWHIGFWFIMKRGVTRFLCVGEDRPHATEGRS